jgi:hypothetical protein
MDIFNPHANRTSDGVLIVKGLKVRDYNRRVTTVAEDRDVQDWKCCQDESHTRRNDLAKDANEGEHPPCSHDHWFTLENGSMMNGSRLESVR